MRTTFGTGLLQHLTDPRRRGAVATSTVLAVASTGLVALAITSNGYAAAKLDIHDGGVWVTNRSNSSVGEVNPVIRQTVMAAYVEPAVPDIEMVQDGSFVVVVTGGDKPILRRVDTTSAVFAPQSTPLPPSATVAAGGGRLAVLDGRTGRLWVADQSAAAELHFDESVDPVATLGAGGAVAVSAGGQVFAASPSRGVLLTIPAPGAQGDRSATGPDAVAAQSVELDALRGARNVQVSAVGDTPVLLLDHARVLVPGNDPVALPEQDEKARLQQPSSDGVQALVATSRNLYRVPLSGADPVRATSKGGLEPSSPVQAGGCGYAVWSGAPRLATVCGDADAVVSPIGDGDSADAGRYVLRLNRGRVVVNNADQGDVYLVDDPKTRLPDFTSLAKKTSTDQSVAANTQQETATSRRDRDNRRPSPIDDDLGARAGLARLLPLLANDTDPDGDVLTITDVEALPKSFGELRVVENGRSVEFLPAASATGQRTVAYTVSDGRTGGTAQARVRLRIVPQGQNQPPVRPVSTPVISVRASGTVTYAALADWTDPDGDPLTLACAGSDPTIICTPDGTVTVQGQAKIGERPIKIVVSDPTQRTTGGLVVRVIQTGSRNPLARPDHATASVGAAVRIRPLDNDTGYSAARLRLTEVTGDGLATVRTAGEEVIEFTGKAAGTSYLTYTVSDGDRTATSVVRVDVAKAEGNRPPAPSPDQALLRGVEPVDVDVLANDSDPDGDVLVVSSVTTPGAEQAASSAAGATVVGHRYVRVVPGAAALQEPQTFEYTVSDGRGESRATLTVRSASTEPDRPPVARDDRAVVRAGNPLAVKVLENDTDPQGGRLTLAPTVSDMSFRAAAKAAGRPPMAYGTGDAVRLLAPDVPGTNTLTYPTRTSGGVPASAYLTVQVIAQEAPNTAPQPLPLDARAVAGQRVVIPVPLSGMDPDGDAVSLATPPTQPSQGVVELDPNRPDALIYTPRQDARGTDTFTYAVTDALGLAGSASVRVGVAAPPSAVEPPVAVNDSLRVRNTPGRKLRASVLGNDSSPAGAPITFVREKPLTVMSAGAQAAVAGDGVEVVVPGGATAPIQVSYRIEAAGIPAGAPGILTVTPDPNAPPVPPTTRDDVVRPLTTAPVEITPLANDLDLDGSPADLAIPEASAEGQPAVGPADLLTRVDAGRLKVSPGATDRWGWYTVTDLDDQRAIGLVFVRGTAAPPHLRAGVTPFTVQKGQTKALALADYLVAPSGRPVRLTTAEAISGSGVGVTAKSATGLTVTGEVAGSGAITVEVIDGQSINDAAARRARVSIPVTVTPAPGENRPPTFAAQAVTVRRGGTASIDLERATTDDAADAGRHRYAVTGAPTLSGVTASVAGRTLTVAAKSTADVGTGQVTLTVSDAKNRAVAGTVTVKVTQTDLPPPQAGDCSPASGDAVKAGTTLTVDLAACTVNPDPKTPLTVTLGSLPAATGPPAVSGTRVQIPVGSTFFGAIAVPYTVTDAFGRSDTGRITARVIGLPGAPGAPELVGQPGNSTVALRWSAADPRGGAVDSYTIKAAGVSQTCPGTVTQCQVAGLKNGVEYTFTVAAHNEAGNGPDSPGSAPIMPNTKPDAPTGLTATAGDASAALSWTARSTGSPITKDVVTVTSTQGTRTVEFPTNTTGGQVSRTVPGLTNGISYSFSVVSENAAGISDPTPAGPVVPAGTASAPAAPTVTETGGAVGGQLTVRWNPAQVRTAANGLLTRLVVEDTSGGVPSRDVTSAVDGGSAVFDVQTNGTYTFRLVVTNNGGSSAPSPGTRATAEGTPATATWTAAPVAMDGAARVSFTNVVANGLSVKSVTVTGGPSAVSVQPGGPYTPTISGLTNGTSYRFTVRVCNTSDRCSTSAASAAVIPFGAPRAPAIQISAQDRTVTVSWGATNTNGSSQTTASLSVSGPGVNCPQPGLQADTCTFQGQYSSTYSATFTVQNPAGSNTSSSGAARTADPPTPPSISVGKGGSAQGRPGCDSAACTYIVVRLANMAPNTTYPVTLTNSYAAWGSGLSGVVNIRTDGAGSANTQTGYYFGYPGHTVTAAANGVSGSLQW